MKKLRLGPIPDDRPVRMTITMPATLHTRLEAYAATLSTETGQRVEIAKMIPHMLDRFMTSDRAFGRRRRQQPHPSDLDATEHPSSSASLPDRSAR
jgi:hypothetical protein